MFLVIQVKSHACNDIKLFSPLGTLADRAIYFACVNLARSANLREGLYILLSVITFLKIFFNDFSETNYLKSDWTDFRNFTSNDSFLAVDDRSRPLFSISQGTLPWQPILCKNGQNYLPPALIALSLRNGMAIVLRMSALKAPLIALHRVKNGENRFSSF